MYPNFDMGDSILSLREQLKEKDITPETRRSIREKLVKKINNGTL